MQWIIQPGVGLGPWRFGMSTHDVARHSGALPPVRHGFEAFDGSWTEDRGLGVPTCGYRHGRLGWIGTDRHVPDVTLEATPAYGNEPEGVVEHLYQLNGRNALIGLGSLLFLQIGVTTTGFLDDEGARVLQPGLGDEDYRTLALFSPGAFDAVLDQFQPWVLPTA